MKFVKYKLFISVGLILMAGILFFVSQTNRNNKAQDPALSLVSSDISTQTFSDNKNIEEVINLSMTVNLIQDSSGKFTTNRTIQDVKRIVKEVNLIWSQANIVIDVDSIVIIEIDSQEITTIDELSQLLSLDERYNPRRINAYFAQTLNGANGIAFFQKNMIFLADYTSVNDFRATSHEIGHILGLSHTEESQSRLLYRGVNGTQLVDFEIEQTRRNATIMAQYE